MNPWTYLYVIAGAWAIFTIIWAIALDALELARWARTLDEANRYIYVPPPSILGRRAYVGAIALLVGLWILAAVLR